MLLPFDALKSELLNRRQIKHKQINFKSLVIIALSLRLLEKSQIFKHSVIRLVGLSERMVSPLQGLYLLHLRTYTHALSGSRTRALNRNVTVTDTTAEEEWS